MGCGAGGAAKFDVRSSVELGCTATATSCSEASCKAGAGNLRVFVRSCLSPDPLHHAREVRDVTTLAGDREPFHGNSLARGHMFQRLARSRDLAWEVSRRREGHLGEKTTHRQPPTQQQGQGSTKRALVSLLSTCSHYSGQYLFYYPGESELFHRQRKTTPPPGPESLSGSLSHQPTPGSTPRRCWCGRGR